MYLYKGFEIEITRYSDSGLFSYLISKVVKDVAFQVCHIVPLEAECEDSALFYACMWIDSNFQQATTDFRVKFANFCAKVEVKPQYYFERGYNVDYFLRMVCMIKHTCGKWITETID